MALPYIGPGDPSEIKGFAGMTKQPNRLKFVKGQGSTAVEVWDGPRHDSAIGLYGQLIANGYTDVDMFQTQPGIWRVEGSIAGQGDGAPEDPVDTWQLLATAEASDVLTHPKAQAMEEHVIRSIIRHVQNPKTDESPALQNEQQRQLYELKLRGQDSYLEPKHILRHTVKGTDDALSGKYAMAGTLRIWTSNQMPVLPSSIAGAISLIPAEIDQSAANGTDFLWGWLKQPPTITVDVFGQTQYEEEWYLAAWSLFNYEPYTG